MSKTICLNMIVKNESLAITRCLESVKPIISSWVIVDTGSTDNTRVLIRNTLQGIPGELHERPWVDFAHNRNEALKFAKGRSDYLFFIDADDQLQIAENFVMPKLDKDYYLLEQVEGANSSLRTRLVSNRLDWKWEGVLHETLVFPKERTHAYLSGLAVLRNVRGDGFRSRDPQKFYKDAELLKSLLKKDPKNSRYQFFLAQTYLNAGELKLARENYETRMEMGGSDLEIFWSQLQIGLINERLEASPTIVIENYKRAIKLLPTRAEPYYYLSRYLMHLNDYPKAYEYALNGLSIPKPLDQMTCYRWIYDYGMLMQFATIAYIMGYYKVSKSAFEMLLKKKDLPPNVSSLASIQLIGVKNSLKELGAV